MPSLHIPKSAILIWPSLSSSTLSSFRSLRREKIDHMGLILVGNFRYLYNNHSFISKYETESHLCAARLPVDDAFAVEEEEANCYLRCIKAGEGEKMGVCVCECVSLLHLSENWPRFKGMRRGSSRGWWKEEQPNRWKAGKWRKKWAAAAQELVLWLIKVHWLDEEPRNEKCEGWKMKRWNGWRQNSQKSRGLPLQLMTLYESPGIMNKAKRWMKCIKTTERKAGNETLAMRALIKGTMRLHTLHEALWTCRLSECETSGLLRWRTPSRNIDGPVETTRIHSHIHTHTLVYNHHFFFF